MISIFTEKDKNIKISTEVDCLIKSFLYISGNNRFNVCFLTVLRLCCCTLIEVSPRFYNLSENICFYQNFKF